MKTIRVVVSIGWYGDKKPYNAFRYVLIDDEVFELLERINTDVRGTLGDLWDETQEEEEDNDNRN